MRLPTSLLASAALASVLLCSPPASADVYSGGGCGSKLPDTKTVRYSFVVRGIPADKAIFAYPCGGEFNDGVRLLNEGESVRQFSDSGKCALYAVDKSRYAAFAAAEGKPGAQAHGDFARSALKCSADPSPIFSVDRDDSRQEILEELDVTSVDASACVIASRGIPESDGGCTIGRPAKRVAPWLVALAVPLLLLGLRRRERSTGANDDDGSSAR
ncbi:MAG: hypothetical protein JST00_10680 [Deltaproteobacteria bacterium]|nr:hypothetical protein [Deltaproteobacteria bacterium]